MEIIISLALSINFRPQTFSRQTLFLKISLPKNKKPTRLASGLKTFSLISLTETPPAIRMDAT